MKLLLDMYKGVSKETRDKVEVRNFLLLVKYSNFQSYDPNKFCQQLQFIISNGIFAQLLKNEKTLKDEVEILKAKLIVVTEDIVTQSKKFSDEDHLRQCKKLEGKIEELKKTISNMRQV